MTGVLALAALAVVRWVVPDPPRCRGAARAAAADVRSLRVLRDPELVRLNYGIFALHAVLMALFVVRAVRAARRRPARRAATGRSICRCWSPRSLLMLPPMLISRAARQAEDRVPRRRSACCSARSSCWRCDSWTRCSASRLSLLVFFAAFNLLEARLPSLVSKLAPAERQGHGDRRLQQRAVSRHLRRARPRAASSRSTSARRRCSRCAALLTLSWLLVAWPMSAPAAVGVRT